MKSGQLLDNRYRIERLLGEGGMGAVYLAVDESLQQQVALKTLLPALASDVRAIEKMKREVRTAQRLRHKSICATFDFRDNDGAPFLVMEYVEGDTLSNFIYRQPNHRCDEATFRRLAAELVAAVEYAHNEGVVHRDLKPANIQVKPDGSIRVMDFGIAASLKEVASQTTGSAVTLSIRYASPEQINGEAAAPSMDIYSLGCVFYEMLSGEPPFPRGDVLHQHLTRNPVPIPEIDEALNRFVLSCLDKDPSRRQLNIGTIGESLASGRGPDNDRTIRISNDQTVKLSSRNVATSGTGTTGGGARTIPSDDQVTSIGPASRMIAKYLSLPKSARLALFIFLVAFSLNVTISSMSRLTILATSAGIQAKAHILVSLVGELFLSGVIAWYIYKVCAKSTHLAGLAKEFCAVGLGIVIPLSPLLIDPPAAFLTSFLPGASTTARIPETAEETLSSVTHLDNPYPELLKTAKESKGQLLMQAPVDQKAVMKLDKDISILEVKNDRIKSLQVVIVSTKTVAESVSLGAKYLGSDDENKHSDWMGRGGVASMAALDDDCASLDGALPGQCAAAQSEYVASVRKLVELRIKLQIPCPSDPFGGRSKNWATMCRSITSDVLRIARGGDGPQAREILTNEKGGQRSPDGKSREWRDGIVQRWVPAGEFRMGCRPGDIVWDGCGEGRVGSSANELRDVVIPKGFWMQESEVTAQAYRRVMGENSSNLTGSNLPADSVTWFEAKKYCERVGLRLPAEEEWEYAARGGTTGVLYGELDGIAWYEGNSGGKPHAVKGKKPNAHGLYDMFGNVREWTWNKRLRGGSWSDDPRRISNAGRNDKGKRDFNGFRCLGD